MVMTNMSPSTEVALFVFLIVFGKVWSFTAQKKSYIKLKIQDSTQNFFLLWDLLEIMSHIL